MSLDAGGLAQMTYNHHNSFAHGLGVPGSGFASRGKGSHIKRLSVAPPSQITTIDEAPQANPNPTPRTSRSHLLAGLRTAPKSPTMPSSAPPTQLQQHFGLDRSRHALKENHYPSGLPQTAVATSFATNPQNRYGMNGNGQAYSLPEQILAPPAVQMGGAQDDANIDPDLYAELVATNKYLAQQQMRLQQQLINVTAAAQQFQGLNMNSGIGQQYQYVQSPMTSSSGYYNQQLQNGLQPIVQTVPNQPGLYSVYNPMTGQYGYVMDNAPRAQSVSPPTLMSQDLSHSPPPPTPTFRAQVSPPPESSVPLGQFENHSPPQSTSPPLMEVNPLPPPSANAFRPSHKKASSYAAGFGEFTSSPVEVSKANVPRSAGFPQTPMTGTFGPGQSRAGEHPTRQPRGPPALEELTAKPTAKYEGSKNFATRQRRRAVHNLVRAGLERRGASRGSGSFDSLGSMTPASESEITFSVSSDNDSETMGSHGGSLSGRPSLGSLHTGSIGAIGSERKEMKERSRDRNSTGSHLTTGSVSSEEGTMIGGKLVEIKVEESRHMDDRRKTPSLVLTNAEKRKSSIF